MRTASASAGIRARSAGFIVTVPVGGRAFMVCSFVGGGVGRAQGTSERPPRIGSAAAGAGDAVLAAAVGADALGVEVDDDLGDGGAPDGDPGGPVAELGLDLDRLGRGAPRDL